MTTTGSPTNGLAFDDVQVVYPDGTEAVASATFTIEPGQFVSIVGPSGCGKSTLLRVAAGLLEPTRGTYRVDPSTLAYIFQEPTLLPWRSVRSNAELLLELGGVRKAERRRAADEALRLVGLTGFEEQLPARLSGGMRMRTSLARSLAARPQVFLFDEPFGALDEITRERLQDELLALFAADRFAGLFITHSIQEACFLSDRVMVMSARPGRIVAEFAVPFEYPRRHDLRYTAEFAELNGEVSAALRRTHAG